VDAVVARKTEHSAGIVPVRYSKGEVEYLAIQQKLGHWDFPKGRLNDEENDIEAARRELFEETGLRCKQILPGVSFDIEYAFMSPYEDGIEVHKTVRFFVATVDESAVLVLQPAEVNDARWLPYDEAARLLTYEAAKKLLGSVRDFADSITTYGIIEGVGF
jgi:bis(5'-nucleosidyl)-tetraphosphatase